MTITIWIRESHLENLYNFVSGKNDDTDLMWVDKPTVIMSAHKEMGSLAFMQVQISYGEYKILKDNYPPKEILI